MKNCFYNTLRGLVPAYIPIFIYDFINRTAIFFAFLLRHYAIMSFTPIFKRTFQTLLVIVLRENPARLPVMRERTRIICTISR
jgi:hypothetical protein